MSVYYRVKPFCIFVQNTIIHTFLFLVVIFLIKKTLFLE